MVKVWAAEAKLETKMKATKYKTLCLIMEFAVSNAGQFIALAIDLKHMRAK
jgi:hypothetical protein